MLGEAGEVVEAHIKTGTVVAQKYRIEELLGAGGMGAVFAATHLSLDERVAIKVLLPAALKDEATVKRFSREARAAVKIKGEHVVRVLDVGKLETGAPYMVMELLIGSDLGALRADRGGTLGVEETVDFVLQALRGIAEAHALGIVHRDLKPANLFVTKRRDGTSCVKVLDFGISKTMNLVDPSSLTQTSAIVGSPTFMPPEQWLSVKDIDVRADIWSVGAIMFQLITGHPPFEGETVAQLCASVLSANPRPLAELRDDVPNGIEQVILRCLAKDRADRYPNVGELAHALQPFGSANAAISAVESIAATLESSRDVTPPSSGASGLESGPSIDAPPAPPAPPSRKTTDPPPRETLLSEEPVPPGKETTTDRVSSSDSIGPSGAPAPPASSKQSILETSLSGVLASHPKRRSSRIGLAMFMVAVLGLAAVGVVALDRREDPNRTTTSATIGALTSQVAMENASPVIASSAPELPTMPAATAAPSEDHVPTALPAVTQQAPATTTAAPASTTKAARTTPPLAASASSLPSQPLRTHPEPATTASVTSSAPPSTFKRSDLGGRH